MGYHEGLKHASAWLASIQGEDDGWGLAPGQASSIVNTSEAVYVLTRAGGYESQIERGIRFIERNVFEHIESRGPRVRYPAFALQALCEHPDVSDQSVIKNCCKWVDQNRNEDNGWSNEVGEGSSQIFPTFLGTWSLQIAEWSKDRIKPSLQWILANARTEGWALDPRRGVSPVATAFALLCLGRSKYRNHDRVEAGKEFLLQTRHWGMEEEVIQGTVWKHCIHAWVLPALMLLEESPYATVVAEGVRHINANQDDDREKVEGWVETGNNRGKTIRSQYWSVMALGSVYRAFDPGIHVPRIDAERAEGVLSEPKHVKIAMQSQWATIIPSSLYRAGAYTLLISAPLFLFGAHKTTIHLSSRIDALIAAGLLFASWLLIEKRKRYFRRRMTHALTSIIGALAGLSLLFGLNVLSILSWIRKTVSSLISFAFSS